jgi:thiosulfate dehydrogenase [quinone] large subunit
MTESRSQFGLKPRDIAIAYLLLRVLIGVNFFNRGVVRVADIPGFVEYTVGELADSYFPEFLVRINSYLVPPVELIVGILITLGLATRSALIATFILMIILKLGVTSVENWGAAQSMLIYGIVLFILLAGSSFNIFSLDYWMQSRRAPVGTAKQGEGILSYVSHYASLLSSTFANSLGKKRRRKPQPASTRFR